MWFSMLLSTVFKIFCNLCRKLGEMLMKIDKFRGYFYEND